MLINFLTEYFHVLFNGEEYTPDEVENICRHFNGDNLFPIAAKWTCSRCGTANSIDAEVIVQSGDVDPATACNQYYINAKKVGPTSNPKACVDKFCFISGLNNAKCDNCGHKETWSLFNKKRKTAIAVALIISVLATLLESWFVVTSDRFQQIDSAVILTCLIFTALLLFFIITAVSFGAIQDSLHEKISIMPQVNLPEFVFDANDPICTEKKVTIKTDLKSAITGIVDSAQGDNVPIIVGQVPHSSANVSNSDLLSDAANIGKPSAADPQNPAVLQDDRAEPDNEEASAAEPEDGVMVSTNPEINDADGEQSSYKCMNQFISAIKSCADEEKAAECISLALLYMNAVKEKDFDTLKFERDIFFDTVRANKIINISAHEFNELYNRKLFTISDSLKYDALKSERYIEFSTEKNLPEELIEIFKESCSNTAGNIDALEDHDDFVDEHEENKLDELSEITGNSSCSFDSEKSEKTDSQRNKEADNTKESAAGETLPWRKNGIKFVPVSQRKASAEIYVSEIKFCCFCGAKLPPEGAFCSSCGKRVR